MNIHDLQYKVLRRFSHLKSSKRLNTRIFANLMGISYEDALIKNFTKEQCEQAMKAMDRYEDNYMSDDSANEFDYPYESLLGPFY